MKFVKTSARKKESVLVLTMIGSKLKEAQIELIHLSKKYNDKTILKDVNLKINRGEFVSIVGPSGSGKSTLLKIIAGLESYEGKIENRIKSEYIGYVFQESNLLSWRTVEENIRLPIELKKVSKNIDPFLDLVKLRDAASLYPHQLSGGMKMRVSLARALVTEPQLVLLDEPFSALDEIIRHELEIEYLRIHKKNKITTLLVTHSITQAILLSNRVLFLNNKGEIFYDLFIELTEEERILSNLKYNNYVTNAFAQLSLARGLNA